MINHCTHKISDNQADQVVDKYLSIAKPIMDQIEDMPTFFDVVTGYAELTKNINDEVMSKDEL